MQVVDAFSPGRALRSFPARLPSTRPVASWYALLLASATPAVFCEPDTTHGHTLTSLQSSRASGAFASLLAGTNRCQHALAFRCVSVPRTCERRRARANPGKSRAGALERRRGALRERYRTCPPRGVPGTRVAGGDVREVWRASRRRSGQDPGNGCRLTKGDSAPGSRCLLPQRNPYATGSVTMSPTRARRDRGPITPPPWRHCSGVRAPFVYASPPPAPDEESDCGGPDRQAPEAEAPPD